jgi:multidrug transporter EmrE-like cation transporter
MGLARPQGGMTVGYAYVALTVLLTVYGQIVLKWRIGLAGPGPEGFPEKLYFLVALLANPWVISAFVAAFAASLAWMGAMTKFELSHAYPFMSLNFVLVLVLAALLFHEPLSAPRVLGVALIVLGVVVGSRG